MDRIGIDIGGTSAKLGVVDDRGCIGERAQVPTGRDMTPEALVSHLTAAAASLTADREIAGLGIAAPGFRMPDGEGVWNVSNIPRIDEYPLRSRLETATGLPAVLDNDANAAALGEFRYGGAREACRPLVVTLGTGIGAGMVVDGRIHRVSYEGLGDPGHVLVVPGGPRCACGGRGCAEAVAAIPALLRRAEEGCGRPFAGLAEVVTAAREGDAAARQAFETSALYLGSALATLTHLLGPDLILLGGGGLDAAEDLLTEPIREAFFAHVQPFLGEKLTLGRAALGNDAGVIGAAALCENP